MTVDRLAVSEVFGPTVQGEGPSAGHPAVFFDLRVVTWPAHGAMHHIHGIGKSTIRPKR